MPIHEHTCNNFGKYFKIFKKLYYCLSVTQPDLVTFYMCKLDIKENIFRFFISASFTVKK